MDILVNTLHMNCSKEGNPSKPSPHILRNRTLLVKRSQASPYNFENPEELTAYLTGCETLFNTYWVRFNYKQWSFDQALENTKILFTCAKNAGVKKIVQISVTNPSEQDDLPYYQGKAHQEKMVRELGVDYAIVRPTLVFGTEDILVNNIAWTIRKFPIVPIFGTGDYQVQPIFVADLATIAVEVSQSEGSQTIDAVGPEVFTYKDFLRLITNEFDRKIVFLHTPPAMGIFLGRIIGWFVKDVVLTKDELRGLMANKLTSTQSPNGKIKFSAWLHENKSQIGSQYTSELNRHFYWQRKA